MNFDFKLEPGRTLKKLDAEKCDKPEITVITPFYNTKREYIEQTAKSVLNQTYTCFEWIIVDDGSTNEESLKVLEDIEKLDDRIRVLHKQNEGLSLTRDYGAKNASESSKYLLFIDDDDLIVPTFMECAYWTLETNPGASWAYSDSIGFDAQEYVWRKGYNPIRQKKINNLVSVNFIRKKDFFEAGGYELREKGVFEDWNFWLKLIAREKYPVRMSSISIWYRRKAQTGELARATANRKKAMEYINATVSTIKKVKKGIQYPKQDYDWDIIPDQIDTIKRPILKKNEKIKILMMVPWMITGGADKFNLDLIKNANKDKFDFIIVTTQPSNNELKQQFDEYAYCYELPAFLDRKYWIAFINYLIKKNNINLIFNTCSQFGYNCLPYLKGQNPNIPIIDYVHMEEWYWRNGGYSRDSAAFGDVIDKTLFCNKNSEKILVEHFKRNKSDVDTVYIGVDEEQYNPKDYNKKDILDKLKINAENKYIISFVCRIANQKRPHLMIDIINELHKKRQDFIVVVAGDGPMLEKIKKRSSKLGLQNCIIFLGNCKNTQEIYAISDMNLNCSIKEGVALTSYESLSMGIPVVSSDVGGQKELIDNSVGKIIKCYQKETEINNFNYSDEEINDYVNAIEDIFNNLDKYKLKCRERIIEKFSLKNMVLNMEEIFENAVKKPNEEKTKNGLNLGKMKHLTKELITQYLITTKIEYDWLCSEFNKKYVDGDFEFDVENEKRAYYEQTLEYKIKHVIVVILRKIKVYDFCKKLVGKK